MAQEMKNCPAKCQMSFISCAIQFENNIYNFFHFQIIYALLWKTWKYMKSIKKKNTNPVAQN